MVQNFSKGSHAEIRTSGVSAPELSPSARISTLSTPINYPHFRLWQEFLYGPFSRFHYICTYLRILYRVSEYFFDSNCVTYYTRKQIDISIHPVSGCQTKITLCFSLTWDTGCVGTGSSISFGTPNTKGSVSVNKQLNLTTKFHILGVLSIVD